MTEYKKVIPLNKRTNYSKIKSNNDRKWAATSSNTLSYVSVGEGEMYDDFIRRPEFEEHKKHINTRFDSVEEKLRIIDAKLDKLPSKTELENILLKDKEVSRKESKNDKRQIITWLITITLGLLGLLAKVFGWI
ncbi:hypothetical protein GTN30_06520 [Macrococcoides canis]|uniref:Uncharacterized protein n=1 Tax=Macrococcoides canis TaxID=1855823 RepID=A0AAE6X2F3_9STAP|nr:hypothetical protein [Macrococcus canis]QIH78322.1 hypothetical protein GTN30_06520 [Macrococcus canis]